MTALVKVLKMLEIENFGQGDNFSREGLNLVELAREITLARKD